MIRILVLVLVAANLLYFGWSRWIRDERPQLVAPEPGPPREQAAPAAAAAAPSAACTTVGPVRDEVRALEIEQVLVELQLSPVRRNATESVREGWWVYVTSPNAAAQQRALRAIQGAGIRDAFAMPDDPENRVSVGLFSDEERATGRADAVRRLRLDPVVNERMQQQASVWFDLPGAAPAAVDLGRLNDEGIEVQELRIEACPADATVPVEGAGTPEDAAAPAPAGPA
jgi:hypothetical protein